MNTNKKGPENDTPLNQDELLFKQYGENFPGSDIGKTAAWHKENNLRQLTEEERNALDNARSAIGDDIYKELRKEARKDLED